MSEDGKVVYKIEADDSSLDAQLNDVEKKIKDGISDAAQKASENVESAAKETGEKFEDTVEKTMDGAENKVSKTASKIAKAIGSAFAVKKVIEFGKAAVNVASDLSEVQNVVDTTFGPDGSDKVNEWAENAAEAFGESELQAKQFTSTLGAMFKSMGMGQSDVEEMSMSLSGLAGDMASFYNLDPTVAFEKLRSGISGETEPLKQLGINLSVANLEAFALSEGITKSYESMTQAEQATLRYNYIMSATADAQGDFAKTSDSFANQQRILQLEIQTLMSEIGQDLMPIAKEILSVARSGIQWIRENKDAIEKLTVAVGSAATAYAAWKAMIKAEELYDSAVKGIKGMTKALSDAEKSTGNAGSAMLSAFGPEGLVVAGVVLGIGAIIAIVNKLKEAQEEAMQKQYEYMDSFTSLADYRANGLVSMTGGTYNEETKKWEGATTKIDYAKAKQMQDDGTFKKDNTALEAAQGRTITSIKELASRHQSGEDFVMSDWTPAYLDYGERVLTAAENSKYTAMGGVDGMERIASSKIGSQGGQASVRPSMQTVILQCGREELGRVVYELNNEQTRRIGVRLTGVDK